jgi:hypothetical protein
MIFRITTPAQAAPLGWALLALVLGSVAAQDPPKPRGGVSSPLEVSLEAHNESLARQFVESHHPELLSLFDQLQKRKPKEYQNAVRDTLRVRSRLENLAARDRKSYQLELEAWKLESQIHLLLARHLAKSTSLEDDHALKDLLESQRRNLVARQEYERERLTKRLQTIEAQLKDATGDPDKWIGLQMSKLQKQAESQTERKSKRVKP